MLQTLDLSQSPWASSSSGTGSAVTATGAAGIAPDGTTTATKIVVSRTTTAGGSVWFQSFTGTAANYCLSAYVEAFGAGDVGNTIGLQYYNGVASAGVQLIKLLPTWQRVFLCASGLRNNLNIGYQASIGTQTGTTNILVWVPQAELAPNMTQPTSPIPCVATSCTRNADNVTIGGIPATMLAATTQTVVVKSYKSQNGLGGTIIDANGTSFLQKISTNAARTLLTVQLQTPNTTAWAGTAQNDLGLAINLSGGVIQLNGGSLATDASGRAPSTPFKLGSTSGTSNFFNGYISRLTLYNTKLASPQ
jgi:hypothetical protein